MDRSIGAGRDRTLLDFSQVAVGREGLPAVLRSDSNRTVKAGVGFARQISGPGAFSTMVGGR